MNTTTFQYQFNVEFNAGYSDPLVVAFYDVTGKAARLVRRVIERFQHLGEAAYVESAVYEYRDRLLKMFHMRNTLLLDTDAIALHVPGNQWVVCIDQDTLTLGVKLSDEDKYALYDLTKSPRCLHNPGYERFLELYTKMHETTTNGPRPMKDEDGTIQLFDFRYSEWGWGLPSGYSEKETVTVIGEQSEHKAKLVCFTSIAPEVNDLLIMPSGQLCQIYEVDPSGNPSDMYHLYLQAVKISFDKTEVVESVQSILDFAKKNNVVNLVF